MGIGRLSSALRLSAQPRVAFVGSGGKTTALFRLARELPPPVIITATTHLGLDQAQSADRHVVLTGPEEAAKISDGIIEGILVITGPAGSDRRTSGLDAETVERVRRLADERGAPLLIEADGSRQKPLKAPAEHEPAVPAWVDQVVVVVGATGLGKPLDAEWVHRPAIFCRLTGLAQGDPVTAQALQKYLNHPEGGLKNIPALARRSVFINQADTPALQAEADLLGGELLASFGSVVVGALEKAEIFSVHEKIGGVILAAGESKRLGRPKQLLIWQGEPLIRRTARIAVEAGLSPVIVVTGSSAGEVRQAVEGLSVEVVHNADWQQGQSSSLQSGLGALPAGVGGAVFLLSDQPFINRDLVRRLAIAHRETLAPVIAPEVEGRRANPVLIDRAAFEELRQIRGDVGGRAIFSRYPVTYVPWNDPRLLLDIDTPEDFERLQQMGL